MSETALFHIDPPQTGGGTLDDDHSIRQAVERAFSDLEEAGLLGPIERAKRAALIKAAGGLDRGLSAGKVSVATSTVLKQVMEGLDTLPRPVAGADPEMDAFAEAVAALTRQCLDPQAQS